jgi:HlyD family secretion protein
MDFKRSGITKKRNIRRIVYAVLVIVLLAAVTWGISSLEPALPSVESASVWMGNVERGSMVIEVRGNGTLVPEEIRWVTASTNGRIEKIPVQPGSTVTAETILAELDDPALEQDSLSAELQVKIAVAELQDLRVEIENRELELQSQAASVQADYQQTRLEADRYEALAENGLVSDLDLRVLQITAEELLKRNDLEQKRLAMNPRSREARIAAKEAEIDQLQALADLRREQVERLEVRAGINGVLQEIEVEMGQQVQAGDILGKVAVPGRLKAELRVPETQIQNVRLGLSAVIDTRSGLVPGKVSRIDPAAREGTVTVDISFSEVLPEGSRPDQNVEGTIQIDRLEDVLKIRRPVFGQANSSIKIFKLLKDTNEAVLVPVRLGRSSVTTIQVLEGLKEGDRVILSDTSEWDQFDRIKLN